MLPEEFELNKKLALLERLGARLAFSEEQMATVRADLEQFEAQYKMQVGRLYAEQDEIEAQIAEEEAKLVPDDEEIKKRAEELRRRAEESAADAAAAATPAEKQKPTDEARRAYRDLARAIHPDLALDPREKDKRHALMAELNEAYAAGDRQKLDRLAADLRQSPDAVFGTSVGDDLVRCIRQIFQVKRRLIELRSERTAAEASELYALWQKAADERAAGRDLLKQMAERAQTHIRKSERRLVNLKNVNQAQEEYVKDRFGMDISEFR